MRQWSISSENASGKKEMRAEHATSGGGAWEMKEERMRGFRTGTSLKGDRSEPERYERRSVAG